MWQQNLQRLGPLILAAYPATLKLAPIIIAAVSAAEEMLRATGPQKKAAALKLVDAGVAALNVAAGQQVMDPTLAHTIADVAIDPLITCINAWSKTSIGQ